MPLGESRACVGSSHDLHASFCAFLVSAEVCLRKPLMSLDIHKRKVRVRTLIVFTHLLALGFQMHPEQLHCVGSDAVSPRSNETPPAILSFSSARALSSVSE